MCKCDSVLSLFPYYGGKYKWVKDLVELVLKAKRQCNANIYVEPYLGGGRTFLNLLDNAFKRCIINELNGNLFILWKVLLDLEKTKHMVSLLKIIPVDKSYFQAVLNALEHGEELDDITRAAYTYYALINSRDAAMKSYSGKPTYLKRCDKIIYKRNDITKSNITLCNDNALDLLPEYLKLPNAVVFLDPPYWEDELVAKNVYKENEAISTVHHKKLIDLLCSEDCKAKVILCGYYKQTERAKVGTHIYDKLLIHSFHMCNFPEEEKGSSNIGTKATESVWLNF